MAMDWTAAQVAEATGGRLRSGAEPTAVVSGVTIDSRRVGPGALFVPLRAERDGHDFIDAALQAGAGGYLFEPGAAAADPPAHLGVAVEVEDTLVALGALGRAARDRLAGPVVGITGSVGKTSTKDLAAAALGTRLRVAASEVSFNNELGVPLTLANAAGDTEVAVVEMGTRRAGQIRALCLLARPTVGVVTAAVAAHTETFGGLDGVAAAKAELIEALDPAGMAILNADDPRVSAMAARSAAPVLRYSAEGRPGVEVTAADVVVDGSLRAAFTMHSPWGSAELRLEARGIHQVGNALAAATVALCCGVDIDAVAAGLARGRLSPWRMEVTATAAGGLVVNDAYNANPTSMAAALRSLAALSAERRVAVLGAMAELGALAETEHAAIAALAAELGIEVVAVGTDLYGGGRQADLDEVASRLRPVGAGVAVLVKGSRVAGLERLAAALGA